MIGGRKSARITLAFAHTRAEYRLGISKSNLCALYRNILLISRAAVQITVMWIQPSAAEMKMVGK